MEKYLGEEDIGSSEIEGDYEWMSPDFIRNHADTIIWAPKNNIMWSYHHADSLVFGAWLSEMVTHLGLWSEAWYWSDAGYTEVFSDEYQTETDADFSHMPSALWVQMQLMSMSKGAVYYHFGGESGIVNDAAEYHEESNSMVWIDEGEIYPEDLPVSGMWDMHGHVMPTFQRYVAPFIEAVVSQQLIPTREDVLEEVHAAVLPGTVESSKGSFACYGDYAPLYRSTYGIENWVDVPDDDNDDEFMENYGPPTGCRTDLIPSSGRYYWLPILPHPIESLPDVDIDIFEVEDLVSSADVRRGLDGLYPERWTGTAHVTRVGRRVFITNGHENTDTMQDFEIPLESGPVESLCGEVQPHAYLVARHDADGMTIHANANDNGPYTDSRSTWLRLHTSRELTVEVHPTDTPIEQSWDEATGTLEIEVSHSHGAVDLVFR